MAPDLSVAPRDTARARRWRYAGPAAVAGGVLAATAYVALVDPGEPGHYPLCPLKAVTGLDCPACGGLRSVHALSHGDVGAALDQNLAVVLLLPVAVVLWVLWLRRAGSDDGDAVVAAAATTSAPAPTAGASRWRTVPYLLLVALLVFTVARNLPFVPFLRSGLG